MLHPVPRLVVTPTGWVWVKLVRITLVGGVLLLCSCSANGGEGAMVAPPPTVGRTDATAPSDLTAPVIQDGGAADHPLPKLDSGTHPASSTPDDAGAAKYQVAVNKVFDRSLMHRIDVVLTNPAQWKTFESGSDARTNCDVTYDGMTLKNCGCQQAGGGIQSFKKLNDKPSISIKFNEYVPKQELFELDKLTLKNGFQDLSLMNEDLVYEVFRLAGLPARATAHAVVTVNGLVSGVYVMREAVDSQFLTRVLGKGMETGNLYEVIFGGPGEFTEKPAGMQLKNKDAAMRSKADIIALAAAVNGSTPADFLARVSPLLDINRYIRYWAVESVTSNFDGFTYNANNSYMYNHPKDNRFIIFPHGADEGFWAVGNPGPQGRLLNLTMSPKSGIAKKIKSVPELNTLYSQEVARVGQLLVQNQQMLVRRVDQVAQLLGTLEKTGRTAQDIAQFQKYRPVIEGFIKAGGLTKVGGALPTVPVADGGI